MEPLGNVPRCTTNGTSLKYMYMYKGVLHIHHVPTVCPFLLYHGTEWKCTYDVPTIHSFLSYVGTPWKCVKVYYLSTMSWLSIPSCRTMGLNGTPLEMYQVHVPSRDCLSVPACCTMGLKGTYTRNVPIWNTYPIHCCVWHHKNVPIKGSIC